MAPTLQITESIESRLRDSLPDVEVIAVDSPASETLRVFIDSPSGVDLDLCEQVTRQLRDLLSEYSFEVSSPGADRPLTKAEHFQRFAGQRAKVRTTEPVGGSSNFSGTIVGCDGASVELNVDGKNVQIPLEAIRRSNLVREFEFGGEA